MTSPKSLTPAFIGAERSEGTPAKRVRRVERVVGHLSRVIAAAHYRNPAWLVRYTANVPIYWIILPDYKK